MKENLNAQQDFLGFYFRTNIKSETIVNTIKDALLRSNFQLQNCRWKHEVLRDTMGTGGER